MEKIRTCGSLTNSVVTITALLCSLACSAQRIADFTLLLEDQAVVVKFNITPGPSCSGFSVLHSTDSLNFVEAHYDPGICGNQPVKESKSYTHTQPKAGQRNFYRVRLEPYVEQSDPKGIFVAGKGPENLRIYPNPQYPGDRELLIALRDKTLQQLEVKIYDLWGSLVKTTVLRPRAGKWVLPTEELGNGLYFLQLPEQVSARSFKFVVLR